MKQHPTKATIKHTQHALGGQFHWQIGEHSAVLDYMVSNNTNANNDILIFHHTFVPKALEGQAIGTQLTKYALDFAKEQQKKVLPTCGFVAHFIKKHSDYQHLLV